MIDYEEFIVKFNNKEITVEYTPLHGNLCYKYYWYGGHVFCDICVITNGRVVEKYKPTLYTVTDLFDMCSSQYGYRIIYTINRFSKRCVK